MIRRRFCQPRALAGIGAGQSGMSSAFCVRQTTATLLAATPTDQETGLALTLTAIASYLPDPVLLWRSGSLPEPKPANNMHSIHKLRIDWHLFCHSPDKRLLWTAGQDCGRVADSETNVLRRICSMHHCSLLCRLGSLPKPKRFCAHLDMTLDILRHPRSHQHNDMSAMTVSIGTHRFPCP